MTLALCPDDQVLVDSLLEAGARYEEFGPGLVVRAPFGEGLPRFPSGWITLNNHQILGLRFRGTWPSDYGVHSYYIAGLADDVDKYYYEDLSNI